MKPWRTILVMALFAAGIAMTAQAQVPEGEGGIEEQLLKTFHTISSHELYDYCVELTSKKYNGRLSGTPEYLLAADWVASKLEEWGIKPYGDNGSYFQSFHSPYTIIEEAGTLSLQTTEEGGLVMHKPYAFPLDFYPGVNTDSGSISGEVVYVGYGISAPEFNYDDYKRMDVRGKIVLVDPGLPVGRDHAQFSAWVPYDYHQYKQSNAVKHGAVGMLYIGKSQNPNTMWQQDFIYAHVTEDVAADLFEGSGKEYKATKENIKKTLKPASFETGKKVLMTMVSEHHPEGEGCNVIGLIEGTDPVLKDEVIIFGGHLDAVGNNTLMMPGALDNASGCADIMGAARALAESGIALKRSVMFLFIGGEECGLLGSQHYCKNPKFPMSKTVVYFNLDMVGNGAGLSVGGGKTHAGIFKFFEEANKKYIHRRMRTSEARKPVGRPRSDSVIFAQTGYRTMSIGTTDRIKELFYHHPGDTVETLTPEIMEDVSKMIFLAVVEMANADEL